MRALIHSISHALRRSFGGMTSPTKCTATVEKPATGKLGLTLSEYAGRDGMRVRAAGVFAKAGIAAGDVITSIAGKETDDHVAAAELIKSLKEPFVVEYIQFPERPYIVKQRAKANSLASAAVKWAVPTPLMLFSSVMYTQLGGLVAIVSSLVVVFALWRRWRPFTCQLCAIFHFLMVVAALVAAGQEVRRCTSLAEYLGLGENLCTYPNLYKNCELPCGSDYEPLHWPAVVVTAMATIYAARAALAYTLLSETVAAVPKGIKID